MLFDDWLDTVSPEVKAEVIAKAGTTANCVAVTRNKGIIGIRLLTRLADATKGMRHRIIVSQHQRVMTGNGVESYYTKKRSGND